MGLLNLTPPSIGQPNATEDVDIVNAFSTIQTWANGNVDESNLASGIVGRLGLNGSGLVGRGVANIAATEARTNVAYGTLTTPDQVASVNMPTNGLLAIFYQATWQESVQSAAKAAIFIGATQLKLGSLITTAPAVQEASLGPNAAALTDLLLTTGPLGLASLNAGGNAIGAYTGDVTTGQVLGGGQYSAATGVQGGPVYVFAAAGSYTVSVQFKASSGTVTVKNRRLWVASMGFA